jgi:CRISPR-associated endonuclease/helicase Cas3
MNADFRAYFHALWGHDPFPWQQMLAERVASGQWPQALDLPTASGKTACIDIAVYALAAQADRPLAERTAPRRIWFVVDRRIVVDEAFERARKLAATLSAATGGPLKEIADRLRDLSGTDRPLAVGRLRGGILRDDGWARIPSQPAVITSTVDQLGSRLLFRGYGHSLLAAPIFAGLAANDSLIVLDEAHCAVPFMETLRAISRYRGPAWAEAPVPAPFAFVVMSATPPADIPGQDVFPGAARARALDHPELGRRLRASKPAELVMIGGRRPRRRGGSASGEAPRDGDAEDDALVVDASEHAAAFVRGGRRRVAVMVNRVRTAAAVARRLAATLGDEADVVLLTGRMRPFDRDRLIEQWSRYLRAHSPEEPERPVAVVATQCLEVGADFSFDALVTECASLDALRQRFGRLARLGASAPAPAVILAREADLESEEPDPVYGEALRRTWEWLWDGADEENARRVVDLGVEALEARVQQLDDLSPLLAPTLDAPVLLPAHLDLLCQTAPPPQPEPDVSLYLHGRAGPPGVSVVWRCDLAPDDSGVWAETVALCPPVSGEMLEAPLWRVRAWLADRAAPDETTDVEGADAAPEERVGRMRPCLVWRGRDRSRVVRDAREIAPGDVVVVPAAYGIAGLGHASGIEALGAGALDVWEPARRRAGQPPAVRLHRDALDPWLACPPLAELLAAAESPVRTREAVQDAIKAVLDYRAEGEEAPPGPPPWWLDLLRLVQAGRIEDHPAGGVVLLARPAAALEAGELDLFADDDDLMSASNQEVALDDHAASVRRAAERLAAACLPEGLRNAVEAAGYWHDVGKLDERFQLLLHQGDEVAAAAAVRPLAKSAYIPPSPARRRTIREASGLPENFRHEMLSAQLVERYAELPADPWERDLVVHLVASHHGYGRPFAPVCVDDKALAVAGTLGSVRIELAADDRQALPPPHRLDSAVPERFWRLTRRYGWWGLAYLEAVLRLADWYGSRVIVTAASMPRHE